MIGKEGGMCWWLGKDRYGGVECEGDMVWSMWLREAIGVVIVEKY